jgi:Ca-activated chloride channel family protein
MNIEWTHPWLGLFGLLALPVWLAARRAPGLVLFSSLRVLPHRSSTWRTMLSWIPDALAALSIVALAVALAGPRRGEKDARIRKEGIAIVMAVDTSSSMAALDLSEKDKELTRLDAIKRVFEKFVAGRPDDAIGMVGFARYADTRSPLTLDHDNLVSAARAVQLTPPRSADDGTAIGDGLALAVERLAASPAPSKVVILLTDGSDNASQVTPDEAAEMARLAGVKVYAIGAGTNGSAPMRMGDELVQVPVRIDEDLLRAIASTTGGAYFRADNADALKTIYGEIDHLERTEFEETRFYEYQELYDRFVALGLIAAVLGLLLRASLFRRLP